MGCNLCIGLEDEKKNKETQLCWDACEILDIPHLLRNSDQLVALTMPFNFVTLIITRKGILNYSMYESVQYANNSNRI